jgi:hypothetical protein
MVMIGFLLIAIVIVLALGLVFKLLKFAIIIAIVLGGVVVVRNLVAGKRLK